MKNIFSEIKIAVKEAKKEYSLKLLTSILIRGLLLIIPVLFSLAINYITNGRYDMAILMIIISIIITTLYRFCEGANQYAYYKLYNKLSNYYTSLAIEKTNDNSMYSLSRFDLGTYTNTVLSDVNVICSFLSALVIRVVQILEFLIIFIYFFNLNIYIFISAVVVTIIMIFIAIRSGEKVQALNEKAKTTLDKATSSVHEYFLGIKEIKSYNLYNNISPIVCKKSDDYLQANAEYNTRYQYNNQIFLYTFEVIRLLTILYCVYLVKGAALEIGVILIIYNYYQKIIDNYSTVLTINVEVRNLRVSLYRYNKILEYSKVKNDKKYLEHVNIDGNIEFKNILYGNKENPILNHVSFKIPKNSITVITGKQNNGKSGIFDLLLKLNRQHEGDILIDGYNINDFDEQEYFDMVSSSRKQVTFFKMSIKDNLSIVKNDEERIVNVCKKMGIHDMIMELPNGYNTIVNNNLNDDLKQLLSIARVLIRNSKVMLFDEVLNGLDNNVQKKLIKLFLELKDNHTIVIICHDKNIFSISDNIIVLNNHKLSETGTFKELVASKKIFYELYGKLK